MILSWIDRGCYFILIDDGKNVTKKLARKFQTVTKKRPNPRSMKKHSIGDKVMIVIALSVFLNEKVTHS